MNSDYDMAARVVGASDEVSKSSEYVVRGLAEAGGNADVSGVVINNEEVVSKAACRRCG